MLVVCRQRGTVIFQVLIVTHRIGHIIVRLLRLILIQDRVHDLAVGLPVRGEGIAGRPIHLVDILPQGMRTAQLAGIGRTSGIKRFPFADILIGIVVGPLPLRQGGNTALAEEVTKFVLIAALHERPVEEGTQLGRIPVANIIVFETGTGDVVRHIIGDIVVVHRFRIVIFRTPVHIGDISDLPVADVERAVRGKRNLLVGKPADFSGGFVQVMTKNIPEGNTFAVSYQMGFNTNATFRDFRLTEGSWKDYLGFGAGARSLPAFFPAHLGDHSTEEAAAFTRQINQRWGINTFKAIPDQKISLTSHRSFDIGDWKIGNITRNILRHHLHEAS